MTALGLKMPPHANDSLKARIHYFLLPAFNEQASICDLLKKIRDVCINNELEYKILIVDDGSTDKTAELALSMSEYVPVTVLTNYSNEGLGFSVRRGLRAISENSDSNDLIITMDADLTQDPKYIITMLNEIEAGADIVVASRYRKGSGTEGLSLFRHMLSLGASVFMLTVYPIKGLRDYSCGYRMYKVPIIRWGFNYYGNDFITESGFACMVEIAARLRGHAKFKEIPFVLKYDEKRKPSAMKIFSTIKAYNRVISRIRQGY